MRSLALEPASARSHAELAALFTAAYEGYSMPVSIDEATFSYMARAWDYDLGRSLVATDAGTDVGLCMLAVRGEDAWIGGVGVIPNRRGQGIGEGLMRAAGENARARSVKRLWLEVLVQNEPAITLYEKLGYKRIRKLEVWSHERGELVSRKHKVPAVPVPDAIGRSETRLPWQRADATVSRLPDAQALLGNRGSLVYRSAGGTASVLQLEADSDEALVQLLGSLPEETTRLSYLNGPEGDPLNAVLESLGGTRVARQHEMLLEL
ncbi:MAG TPA: GNAT family N-acetyltransferase [Gaiellaceae bacterium]|nr:GNAT family N-acetyltransferase [Gaiellaceae bacterium]